MRPKILIYCGGAAIPEMIRYCQARRLDRFLLVGDENTHAALGARAEAALKAQGWDVRTVVLTGPEVIANEESLIQVLLAAGKEERMYVAVGSGTITDITRFCSHRTRNDFISLPTAPSVDGYTSNGAPLVVRRVKITAYAQPPAAVFADLPTLRAAPRAMVAAGFGDVLGKYTSLADWQLGALLWDEPYSEEIAQRARRALQSCVENVAEIAAASEIGVTRLIEGLFETGLCMLDFGQTHPASGSEHQISHFWEMKLLLEHRPAILHGAKVGLGTILAARRYGVVRDLGQEEIARRLARVEPLERDAEMARIRQAYGPLADPAIDAQRPFLEMTTPDFAALKQRVVENWNRVQEIAATVPPAQEIVRLLKQVGGAVDPQQIGLSEREAQVALDYAHYLRNRFTVTKLGHLMRLW